MSRLWKFAVAVVLGLASVAAASAQTNGGTYGPYAGGYVGASNPWFANHHSSTIEEGVLTGSARLLEGYGRMNALNAQAYNTFQDGYAKALDNKTRYVKTYFETKRLNASYRAEMMPAPLSKEKLDEWNRQDQPARLTHHEYNTDTGRVQWPALLQAQVFDTHRYHLEDLFARRTASEFGVSSPFYRQVNSSTTVLKEQLRTYLRSEDKWFSDQEYIAALNFLNSLQHEARLAPDLDGLVAN
jgi:hypothetical protein